MRPAANQPVIPCNQDAENDSVRLQVRLRKTPSLIYQWTGPITLWKPPEMTSIFLLETLDTNAKPIPKAAEGYVPAGHYPGVCVPECKSLKQSNSEKKCFQMPKDAWEKDAISLYPLQSNFEP